MRAVSLTVCLVGATLLTGCSGPRKPYANNPLLLYYKPTLSDSDTILAEREPRGGPTQPPMPTLAAESPKDPAPFALPKQLPSEGVLPAKLEAPPAPAAPTIIPQPSKAPAPKLDASLTPIQPDRKLSLYSELKPIPAASRERSAIDVSSLPRPLETKFEPVGPAAERIPPVAIVADKPKLVHVPTAKTVSTPAAPVEKPRVPGLYGHDAGYRWLQGVVEKNYRGHDCVRYCDPAVDDEYGGKFIVDDPRLAQFRDGDVIGVSGELAIAPGAGERNRRYTIHDVWLVKGRP
jgi:hypothetical protein